jgi:hypothetical protein
MAFPAGLIAQVDREGNSTLNGQGADLATSQNGIHLTGAIQLLAENGTIYAADATAVCHG